MSLGRSEHMIKCPVPTTTRLSLGGPVRCRDGPLGELRDLVIDPIPRRVTHLVVVPHHLTGGPRLIPFKLAAAGKTSEELSLQCTLAEAADLPRPEEFRELPLGERPEGTDSWDVGVQEVRPMPHYDAGAMVEYMPDPDPELLMTYDRIPKGEVEIQHNSAVRTRDGQDGGRLAGVLVEEGRITHLLLRRGYLWRRHEFCVPAQEITELRTDSVGLRASRRELKAFRS